jgi:uncharacterized lipoprotein YajG
MLHRILFACLAVALMAGPATASTFVAMDTAELVAASESVVQGEVVEVYSFWNREGNAVLTEARVLVNEVVAGQAPSEVVVRTFGGRVGDYVLEAHGFPTFHEGQKVLLFLQRAADQSLRVTGYRLGEYRLVPGKNGETIAHPTLEQGVKLLRADGTPAPRPAALSVETLKNQVRAFARKGPMGEATK